MEYSSGDYKIEIFNDSTYSIDSSDNIRNYDFEYFDKTEYDFPSVFGIVIKKNDTEIKSAVIGSHGGATGIHDNSVIIEKDRVLICCSDSIFCLSTPELDLLWKTRADQATCFEIFKHKECYIIHGELEISRLDYNGKILWRRSGADIFTTLDGKDDFTIKDDYIFVRDFENNEYKFGFNGEILR